ncbi:MAG TPA: helix-turn-helix transcriptional regulator [Actinomycetota bacterium]|nr:helix-turn-helix transcriptional regulator [Actinomycetota bacterium]
MLPTRANRRLRLARAKHGWSQRELARRAGVSVETITRAEVGRTRPGPVSAFRIATALGVPIGEIFPEYAEEEAS